MTEMAAPQNQMREIPLAHIIAGNNPRKYFDMQEFDELCSSVRANGIIQPILIRPYDDGRYVIVAGERRYRAAVQVFGLESGVIPAVVKEMTDEDADCLALVENSVRADMSVTEEAVAAQKVLDRASQLPHPSLTAMDEACGKP